eukprot:m.76870 g.76870  ORF g.76870 m.76870 type:complete len:746 (-) comp12588_c0_seq1:125-2362(-)
MSARLLLGGAALRTSGARIVVRPKCVSTRLVGNSSHTIVRAIKRHGSRILTAGALTISGAAVTSFTVASLEMSHDNGQKEVTVDVDVDSLPLMTLDEVREHRSEESMYVTYKGVVYDVTSFIEHHPGGKELILTAAGLDLGHFFDNYTVHTQSDKPAGYLQGLAVGKLSPEDAARARAETTPNVHVESRMRVLWKARMKLVGVLVSYPLAVALRYAVRLVGTFMPGLGHLIARHLPFSVPGFGGSTRIKAILKSGRRARVAVIGGGVAGAGCAFALKQSGFEVTLYEARKTLSGNARTFDWDVKGENVKSCVSVTAWPPILYKNYEALLNKLDVPTSDIPLSWFLYSKVPGSEGFLWVADPEATPGSLRERFKEDFRRYGMVKKFVDYTTRFFTLNWFSAEPSMYTTVTGLGFLNPLTVFPLHHLCRLVGISQEWWDVVFTPHYTASFLTDKLDNMSSVTSPLIEAQIPLNPNPDNSKECRLTTCNTWADAGQGIRDVFRKMTEGCDVRVDTRVLQVVETQDGLHLVVDEHNGMEEYDRVVFACPSNAVGNIFKEHNWLEEVLFSVPEYADDHHPATGHMHAIMHNDDKLITPEWREEVLKRASNYVEITENPDKTLNIENTYNFGVQTNRINKLDLSEKPPMLISHALGEGKEIESELVRGTGNHARAHPLYSGWNIITMLSMRLVQGRRGVYFCSNWTTPGNCHDMSLLSGIVCAHAIGAEYPFEGNDAAKRDFERLRSLMGI